MSNHMSKLESDIKLIERMKFMHLDARSCKQIRRLKSIIERELPNGLDKFYDRLRATPEVRKFFSNDAHLSRAKNAQLGHWGAISSGAFDERYVGNVRAIG